MSQSDRITLKNSDDRKPKISKPGCSLPALIVAQTDQKRTGSKSGQDQKASKIKTGNKKRGNYSGIINRHQKP